MSGCAPVVVVVVALLPLLLLLVTASLFLFFRFLRERGVVCSRGMSVKSEVPLARPGLPFTVNATLFPPPPEGDKAEGAEGTPAAGAKAPAAGGKKK